jgi:hypothetical protein
MLPGINTPRGNIAVGWIHRSEHADALIDKDNRGVAEIVYTPVGRRIGGGDETRVVD